MQVQVLQRQQHLCRDALGLRFGQTVVGGAAQEVRQVKDGKVRRGIDMAQQLEATGQLPFGTRQPEAGCCSRMPCRQLVYMQLVPAAREQGAPL